MNIDVGALKVEAHTIADQIKDEKDFDAHEETMLKKFGTPVEPPKKPGDKPEEAAAAAPAQATKPEEASHAKS